MICGSFFIFDPFSNQCSVLAAEQVVCYSVHSSNQNSSFIIFVDAGAEPAAPTYITSERRMFMKILVLQYEADGGGVVIPSHTGRDIDILLPPECNHILIVKEEAPRTIYKIYGVDESELEKR